MGFVIGLVVLFSVCASPGFALEIEGLILYLPLDDGSGGIAKDLSGQGNDGVLMGNVEWVDGRHGKAVRISDDVPENMILVEDSDTLDVKDQITMAAWIYIETMQDDYCSVIMKANAYAIHTSAAGNPDVEVEPLIWSGGAYGEWQTPASVPIPFDKWHHVVGTYDGISLKTYVDGGLKGQTPRSGAIDVRETDVVIGRDLRHEERRSAQIIDEVLIFDRAVTLEEVKAIMDGTIFPVELKYHLTNLWGKIKTYLD